jgi:hypothetical protein
VATAADTLARQGVGSNGQVLVADSGVTNGVAWVDPQTNRNVIINGAMQVAQRGTSATFASNYNTVDRFSQDILSGSVVTQSQEADAPTGSGFRSSLKMLVTTAQASPAAGTFGFIQQHFEGQNVQQFAKGTASAKPYAVSFWVKSNVTGTYVAALRDVDNSRVCSATYTINASATWEKKTIIFPADTTGVIDNDNGQSMSIRFWQGAGSNFTSGTLNTTWDASTAANLAVGQTNVFAAINNYWQITGVQLEAGSVATPFEFEDYGITLTKCQRYYCRVQGGYLGAGMAFSTTANIINVKLPTTMRIAPTAIETTGTPANYAQVTANTGTQTCNSGPSYGSSSGADAVAVTSGSASAGLVQGNATFILSVISQAYLGFSAEL